MKRKSDPLNTSRVTGQSILIAALCTATLSMLSIDPVLAQTQEALTFTGNAAVVSDYRYRGISQTRFKPALQVGADLAHSSGAYAGAWATNIKWIKDFGVDGGLEVDLYGGYKTELAKDFTVDVRSEEHTSELQSH